MKLGISSSSWTVLENKRRLHECFLMDSLYSEIDELSYKVSGCEQKWSIYRKVVKESPDRCRNGLSKKCTLPYKPLLFYICVTHVMRIPR